MTNSLLDSELASPYSSPSQRVRVMSEHWTHRYLYCPACGAEPLHKAQNNQPALDFWCADCGESFELKSKRGPFGRKLTDGAHNAMMKRLAQKDSPNLFLLSYRGHPPGVTAFTVIPKHFLVPSLIEKRPPLALTARRAGWVGCNILLEGIPEIGRICLYDAGCFRPRTAVRETWQKTTFLRDPGHVGTQGWLIQIMKAIESLGQSAFTLNDLYRLESEFRVAYPNNKNIHAKVRQQLQRLRDVGYLDFLGHATYRVRGDSGTARPTLEAGDHGLV